LAVLPQHFLNLRWLPQGHGSLRPTLPTTACPFVMAAVGRTAAAIDVGDRRSRGFHPQHCLNFLPSSRPNEHWQGALRRARSSLARAVALGGWLTQRCLAFSRAAAVLASLLTRPPKRPLFRAAAALAGVVACPPLRPISAMVVALCSVLAMAYRYRARPAKSSHTLGLASIRLVTNVGYGNKERGDRPRLRRGPAALFGFMHQKRVGSPGMGEGRRRAALGLASTRSDM